jgi:outer membrane protein OmpA-like peptidoglycan-associated protein
MQCEEEDQVRHLTKALAVTSLAIAVSTFGTNHEVFAQKAILLTDEATTCDIFAHINLDVPSECVESSGSGGLEGVKTRGIVINRNVEEETSESVSTAAISQPEASPAMANDFSVAFRVQFAFDSVDLSGSARSTLDRMAEVLNHDLVKDKVILIEGHADSIGSADYNLRLSERRAEAVVRYLVQRNDVDSNRLVLKAKGESELYDPQNPADGVNRRVEFQNLTDLASVR